VRDYLETREEELHDLKRKWGKGQTATDEKFFKEKDQELRQFRSQLETMILQMGISDPNPFLNLDITLIISEKK